MSFCDDPFYIYILSTPSHPSGCLWRVPCVVIVDGANTHNKCGGHSFIHLAAAEQHTPVVCRTRSRLSLCLSCCVVACVDKAATYLCCPPSHSAPFALPPCTPDPSPNDAYILYCPISLLCPCLSLYVDIMRVCRCVVSSIAIYWKYLYAFLSLLMYRWRDSSIWL